MVFKDRTFRKDVAHTLSLSFSRDGETYQLKATNPVGKKVMLFVVNGDYLDVEQVAVRKLQQIQDELMAQVPLTSLQKKQIETEIAGLSENVARRFFHLIQVIDLQTRECRFGCEWDYAKLAYSQTKRRDVVSEDGEAQTYDFPEFCDNCTSIVDRINRLRQINIRTHFNTPIDRLHEKMVSPGPLNLPVGFARWTNPFCKAPSQLHTVSARSTVRGARKAQKYPLPTLVSRVFGALRELQPPGSELVLILRSNTEDVATEFDSRYRIVQASAAAGYALSSCHGLPSALNDRDYHSAVVSQACVALNQISEPPQYLDSGDSKPTKSESLYRVVFNKIGSTEFRTLAIAHFQQFHHDDLRKMLYDSSLARLLRLLVVEGDNQEVSEAFSNMAADLLASLVRRFIGGHHSTPDYIDQLFDVWWNADKQQHGVKLLVGKEYFSSINHARVYAKATGDMDSPTIAKESQWEQRMSPRVVRTRI